MPYNTFPWGTVPADSWAAKVTRMHPDTLRVAWLVWAIIAGTAACANTIIIAVILRFKSLRSKHFNKFIVGLAFPDLVFSGACAVSYSLHRYRGEWFGGSAHCDVQGFYVTFGFAASIWMNVIISREIHSMAHTASTSISYAPLKTKAVMLRIASVYCISLGLAAFHTIPGMPLRSNADYGLACLPLQHDEASSVAFWVVFAPILLLIPLLLVFWHICSTYLIVRKLGMERYDQDTKAVFAVFIRLLIALLVFWGPAGILIWIAESPSMGFAGGTVSHLQALVSAIIYSQKSDIHQEMRSLVCHKPNQDLDSEESKPSRSHDWESESDDDVAGNEAMRWPEEPIDIFGMTGDSVEGQFPATQSFVLAGGAAGLTQDGDCSNDIFDGSNRMCRFNMIQPDAFPSERSVRTETGMDQPAADWARCVSDATEGSLFADSCALPCDLFQGRSDDPSSRSRLLARERTPMKVVPLDAFLSHGKLPHSRDRLQRDAELADCVVFVSHRWWNVASNEPDTPEGHKYGLLCRALVALKRQVPNQRLDDVVIWIDYACIDQDDPMERDLGISSLVSYVARSDFLVIPVNPIPEAVSAFKNASHPIDLVDYGERAWCRLEVYVFLCVAEILQKPLHCYAYGLMPSGMVQNCTCTADLFSASVVSTGHRSVACGLLRFSVERLQRLGVQQNSAMFSFEHLPTNGQLTHEADRDLISSVQQDVRQDYGRTVLDRALRMMQSTQHRSLILDDKQLTCDDAEYLIHCFQGTAKKLMPRIRKLSMCCNLLRCRGAALLVRELSILPGSSILNMDFSDNFLEAAGAEELQHALNSMRRPLRKLHLARNRLGEGAAKVVAGACRVQKLLDLSDNQIGNREAELIVRVLADEVPGARSSAQILMLAKNNIESQAGQALLAASQVVIDLAQNPIPPAVFAEAAMRQAAALV
eukprot:TRINITY_DN11154_c0_g2_i2.p1 TRINITY_DN11154_c0_g2~~TRINITY_DN11154_c0_g2_i2.p1  ORF type:complete len:932 (-),score=132.18 TRINITY_DN11154_c0_g2_i2:291-3086(-)